MPQKIQHLALLLCLLATSANAAGSEALKPRVEGATWVFTTEGEYNDVRADLIDAIEARGIVISYMAHAASMFQRTAEAVGAVGQVYDHADILLFCKADLSYQLTVANPHNLTFCPYSIAVYTLTSEWDKVYLSIRAPVDGVPEYIPVHEMLVSIIDEVVNW